MAAPVRPSDAEVSLSWEGKGAVICKVGGAGQAGEERSGLEGAAMSVPSLSTRGGPASKEEIRKRMRAPGRRADGAATFGTCLPRPAPPRLGRADLFPPPWINSHKVATKSHEADISTFMCTLPWRRP